MTLNSNPATFVTSFYFNLYFYNCSFENDAQNAEIIQKDLI